MVAVLYYRHRAERQTIVPQHISERPAVAVLGFKNLSGRPESEWISTALSEMLTTELAVGEKLRLVRAEETATGRTDVSLGVNERYSKESLNHLRQTLGIDYVVVGSYFVSGGQSSQIRLDVRLENTAAAQAITTGEPNRHRFRPARLGLPGGNATAREARRR